MSVRSFVLNSTLVVFSLILGGVLLEVGLIVAHRINFTSPLPYGIRDDSTRIGYVRLAPDFDGGGSHGIRYRTNSLGFRDDPVDARFPHVVFLGDSTTFGLGVSHEETYAEQFEKLMLGRNHAVQAVNTATPGQGTLDQLFIFEEILEDERFNVTSVVLGFFGNDISNNFEYVSYMESLKRKKPIGNWKQWLDDKLKGFRAWRFAIGYYFAFKEWLASPSGHGKGENAGAATEKKPSSEVRTSDRGVLDANLELTTRPGREVEWDLLTDEEIAVNRSFAITLEALRTLATMCRNRSLPFFFLYLPAAGKEITEGRSPRYKRFLRDAVIELGGTYVDMAEVYRASLPSRGVGSPPAEGSYSLGDFAGHPGPAASHVIAKTLFDQFLEHGLLATTPAQ